MAKARAIAVDQSFYEDDTAANAVLGQVAEDQFGNKYVYSKASAAISEGEVLIQTAVIQEETVSSSADKTKIETGGVTATWTVNQFEGFYVYVDDGTGEGQMRTVVSNDTTTLTLDRALGTALSVSDSDISLFHPDSVKKAAVTTKTQIVTGVAPVDVASGSYFWRQISGTAAVLAGAALTANDVVIPGDDTAGTCKAATTEDASSARPFGSALVGNANADTMAVITLNLG